MRNKFFDEIGDTLFAVAVAGAIVLCTANLAIQLNNERAALDASAARNMSGELASPQQRGTPEARANEQAGRLSF